MRFLITAGGTREPIDPVRYIANASSGKMGYALALAALEAGHDVTLISAPTHLSVPDGVLLVSVQTAEDMYHAVQEQFPCCDVLIMAAAVADYRVVTPAEHKLKKSQQALTLELEPTVDILEWAGMGKSKRPRTTESVRPFMVGFALEDEDLRARAEEKLKRKRLDMIIANQPAAIGANQSELHIKRPGQPWQELTLAPKAAQAHRLIHIITELLA